MIPLGAWGRDVPDGGLALDVAVFDSDGRRRVFVSVEGPRDDPDGLGSRAAESLRMQGAEHLLHGPRRSVDPAIGNLDSTVTSDRPSP